MKISFLTLFAILISLLPSTGEAAERRIYSPDELGPGFEKCVFEMGREYDGRVVATLVRKLTEQKSAKAVLYIHGFSDYFYQTDMSKRYNEMGFNFYALDLRRCGRSILKGQTPFYIKSVKEYFPEIDSAIKVIRSEGNSGFIINAHSMGGLVTSLYLESRVSVEGLKGLILNSPFLDFNLTPFQERVSIPLLSFVATIFKKIRIAEKGRSVNGMSIHKKYYGAWDFDTIKKPIAPGYNYSGWIRAIHKGQKKIRRGLNIKYPILVMYSDRSSSGNFSEISKVSDVVLDVKDIGRLSGRLGNNVKKVVIPGGMHDLVLSKKSSREMFYRELFIWTKSHDFQSN